MKLCFGILEVTFHFDIISDTMKICLDSKHFFLNNIVTRGSAMRGCVYSFSVPLSYHFYASPHYPTQHQKCFQTQTICDLHHLAFLVNSSILQFALASPFSNSAIFEKNFFFTFHLVFGVCCCFKK